MAASGRSPLYSLPFPLSGDVVDVSGDIQLLALKLDTSLDEIIEDTVGLMVTANTENGVDVTYNDTTGKLNFVLNENYTKDLVAPIVAHDDHIGLTAVYNTITNKVTFEVVGGSGGGGGTSNASLSDMWWLGI
jgi:pantothenate kinase